MERSAAPKKTRVFFALVPDAALQRSLGIVGREAAARLGGRAIVDANLHLTLAFIGNVEDARIEVLRDVLSTLPRHAFVLALDHLGTFRHSDLAWIGPSAVPPALTALQSTLATALADADISLETRPFHAHITLVRRCAKRITSARVTPIEWRVERLALLASIAGGEGVSYPEVAGVALS